MTIEFADAIFVAGSIALVSLMYAALRIVGLVLTQHYRRDLARAGESFLARDGITEEQRRVAQMWLKCPFSGRWPWALVLIVPLLMLLIVVLVVLRFMGVHKVPQGSAKSSDADGDLAELARLSILASLGAAPIATILLVIEGICLSPVAFATRTFGALMRALLRGPLTLEKLSV